MRLAVVALLAALSAVVTFALLYIEAARNEMLIRSGWFEGYSVFFGVLLFVALTFLFRRQSIRSALVFATLATLVLPSAAAFAALLPSYGVAGAMTCIPSLSTASAAFLLAHLAQALIFSTVSYYVVQGIIQA